jgi:hypothetical protein
MGLFSDLWRGFQSPDVRKVRATIPSPVIHLGDNKNINTLVAWVRGEKNGDGKKGKK